ncbi:MAG: AlpA family phage regulatory protein [Planctomycetes bacterium]|nr:AlpA family phage regulatory protein [Planctomycetota bacterium]
MASKQQSEQQLITLRQAAELCGVGKRSFWRYSNSGRAPRPVRLTARCVRWRRAEIESWIERGCPDLRTVPNNKH